jgi:catechol 2,3-dioxygenase-like lactoylglutathione lyase family enzyme
MNGLEHLLSRYERGELSRRQLLAALTVLVAAPAAARRVPPVVGEVKQLNHATLFVEDAERSAAFYQELFGMPVLTRQGSGINLSAGAGFLGIYPARPGAGGRIDHVCLGVEDFDAKAVQAALERRGVAASIRMRDDTEELYLTDPDGIRVQVQDVRYRGGVGRLGDRDPA